MLRRWCILFAMLALTAGTALAATSASAATSGSAGFNPGGPIHLVGASSAARGGISNQAESTNWSGYAGTTGTYTSVSASWTQQAGSEVDCVGRTAEYYAWYEMYPGPSENYSNTVRAGDHFNATVTWLSGDSFSLFIQDTTQGWSHTTDASLTSTPARSSAEVIVEAPCCTNSGGILPLTDFGTVNITSSMANGAAIGNAGGLTEIIMIDNEGRDKDTVSALSGGENFSATWVRSN